MELSKDLLEQVVSEKIAAEVMQSMEKRDREQLIIKGIASAIHGYEFKRSMDEVIKKIAMRYSMTFCMDHDEVRGRIRREANAAVEKFVGVLEKTLLSCMLEMLGGNANGYNTPKVYMQIKKLLNIDE